MVCEISSDTLTPYSKYTIPYKNVFTRFIGSKTIVKIEFLSNPSPKIRKAFVHGSPRDTVLFEKKSVPPSIANALLLGAESVGRRSVYIKRFAGIKTEIGVRTFTVHSVRKTCPRGPRWTVSVTRSAVGGRSGGRVCSVYLRDCVIENNGRRASINTIISFVRIPNLCRQTFVLRIVQLAAMSEKPDTRSQSEKKKINERSGKIKEVNVIDFLTQPAGWYRMITVGIVRDTYRFFTLALRTARGQNVLLN